MNFWVELVRLLVEAMKTPGGIVLCVGMAVALALAANRWDGVLSKETHSVDRVAASEDSTRLVSAPD